MKRIKLIDDMTPFVHDGKLHGRSGTYVVEDHVAAKWEAEGRGTIVEDLGNDYTPQSTIAKDPFFLQKVQDHLPEIFDMFKAYAYKKEDEMASDWREKNQPVDTSKPSGAVESTEENKIEMPSVGTVGTVDEGTQAASTENADDAGEDQSEGLIDTSSIKSDIPDDFPSRTILITNGVTSMEQLKKMTRDDLVALKGMGDRRANSVGVRLSEL